MVVGQSQHPDEWILLKPVQDDPLQAVTGFVNADDVDLTYVGPKQITDNATGDIWISPDGYQMLPADVDLPDHKTTITTAVSDAVTGDLHTSIIKSSNRSFLLDEWTTAIETSGGAPIVTATNFMSIGGGGPGVQGTLPVTPQGPGMGNALQLAEFWTENWGQGEGIAIGHNPNMGGVGEFPAFPLGTAGTDPGDWFKSYGSMPLSYIATNAIPPLIPFAIHEAVLRPVDFGPLLSGTYDANDHGAGNLAEDRPALFWRHTMFERVRFNWGGRANIHRVDHAYHMPRGFDKTEYTTGTDPRLVVSRTNSLAIRSRMFDEAYWLDCTDGTATQITNFPDPTTIRSRRWNSMTHRSIEFVAAPDPSPGPVVTASPFPLGYGAVVVRRLADDFCVGVITRIHPCNESEGVDTRLDMDLPCQIQMVAGNFLNDLTPVPPWSNSVNHFDIVFKSTTKRSAGWQGHAYFVFVGLYSDFATVAQGLYADGELDVTLTEQELPQQALQGALPTITADPGQGDPTVVVDVFPGSISGDPGGGGTGGGTQTALVVEDGTGLATSNSYTTVLFADRYFVNRGGDATWTAATTDQREQALRVATTWLDLQFHDRFRGYPLQPTQALQLPRAFAYNSRGIAIPGVPVAVEKACAEIAVRWLRDPTQLTPDVAPGSNEVSSSFTVGGVSGSSTYSGERTSATDFLLVRQLLMLSGLLTSGDWVLR